MNKLFSIDITNYKGKTKLSFWRRVKGKTSEVTYHTYIVKTESRYDRLFNVLSDVAYKTSFIHPEPDSLSISLSGLDRR